MKLRELTVLALDIGGSSVKSALVRTDHRGARILTEFAPAPLISNGFDELHDRVLSCVSTGIDNQPGIRHVAVSTTGSVDRMGRIITAGHFRDYADISWRDVLFAQFPQLVEVVTLNDGTASTWAEYVASGEVGGGFVHIVVGSGIGGGIVTNSQPYLGDHLAAGTIGHIKVTTDHSVVCRCQRYGCVETVAAAPAVVRAFSSEDDCALHDVVSAAQQADDRAMAAFVDAGSWLGIAIADVMNLVDPQTITIGGGLVAASCAIDPKDGGPYVRAAVHNARQLAIRRIAQVTIIEPASLGNAGGLIGAALFIASRQYRSTTR